MFGVHGAEAVKLPLKSMSSLRKPRKLILKFFQIGVLKPRKVCEYRHLDSHNLDYSPPAIKISYVNFLSWLDRDIGHGLMEPQHASLCIP